MTIFNEQALTYLRKCKNKIDLEVPKEKLDTLWLANQSAKKWFSNFETSWEISDLSEKKLNREELLELINPFRKNRNTDKSTIRKLIVSILAWGGMGTSPTSGKLAIETIDAYEEVCLKLLNGMMPVNAYQEFYKLKKLNLMKGIGPAYYTKLIFFLGDQTGLIMDQWTARSTNLLLNKKIIRLEMNYVSDKNSEQVYKKYLDFISELKTTLNIESISKTEELIFSCSHKKNRLGEHHQACSAWRKYVTENT